MLSRARAEEVSAGSKLEFLKTTADYYAANPHQEKIKITTEDGKMRVQVFRANGRISLDASFEGDSPVGLSPSVAPGKAVEAVRKGQAPSKAGDIGKVIKEAASGTVKYYNEDGTLVSEGIIKEGAYEDK